MAILAYIEKIIYSIRDFLWYYPEYLWIGDKSLYAKVYRVYLSSRPYSHFIFASLLIILISVMALNYGSLKVWAQTKNRLVEGVVVGVDDSGALQKLSKVNPLIPTSIQLEKDLTELIYEPLIRYEQDGKIVPVLARSIETIREGADYQFNLREDVYWHDGKKFNIDDVTATLTLISELDKPHDETSFVQAVKQMAWEQGGPNTIRICTLSPDQQSKPIEERRCAEAGVQKPILANFLELLSFKIMPAHLIEELNTRNIDKPEPAINRFPIGTGQFKFASAGEDDILLSRNDNYYGVKPTIEEIDFRLFRTNDAAIKALENGEIHTFSTTSTQDIREIDKYLQINTYTSPVLSTQYWGLYFNLRKDLNGKSIGPEFLQDVKVRKAISAAINRDRVLQSLLNVGEEAIGPIYSKSSYFNKDAGWSRYDEAEANRLLDADGWIMDPSLRIRKKDNQLLSFKISYADNFDRDELVKSMQQDLADIGVEMIPDKRSLKDLSAEVLSIKTFDTLLYGVSTFVDPDRYELFYSGQQLNLSSYVGTEQTVKIDGNKKVNLPRVDRLLEQGRSFDPVGAKDNRKDAYDKFQEQVAEDAPMVFLYHPQFIYYSNRHVQKVNLSDAFSLEERFRDIDRWVLER